MNDSQRQQAEDDMNDTEETTWNPAWKRNERRELVRMMPDGTVLKVYGLPCLGIFWMAIAPDGKEYRPVHNYADQTIACMEAENWYESPLHPLDRG